MPLIKDHGRITSLDVSAFIAKAHIIIVRLRGDANSLELKNYVYYMVL